MSCSFSQKGKNSVSDATVKEDADSIKQEINAESFDKELTYLKIDKVLVF